MSKKISKFLKKNTDVFCVALVVCAIVTIYQLSEVSARRMDAIVAIIMIITVFMAAYSMVRTRQMHNDAKKQMQCQDITNIRKAYKPYVRIVEEEFLKHYKWKESFYPSWIEEFDFLIRQYSRTFVNEKITDFDVAACLMYALISNNTGKDKVQFGIQCIIPIIVEPKVYKYYYRHKRRLVFLVEKSMPKIDISIMEKEAMAQTVINNISGYMGKGKLQPILDIAYLLEMLYQRCDFLSRKEN